MLEQIVNILASPKEAFRALRERPVVWLPLVVLIAANVIVVMWYYSVVDLPAMIEAQLAQRSDIPSETAEMMRDSMAATPPTVAGVAAAVSASIVTVVLMLLMAGYLRLVSLINNDPFGFKSWLSLVAWSSMPVVVGLAASMVNLLVSDVTQMPPEELNPLSLSALLGREALGDGLMSGLLRMIDLTSLWALGLMVLGYRVWTSRSLGASLLIVTAPLILIFAIAIVIAL